MAEGPQRRPGKTKFAIPRREAPPIDGSYLDRLFADYDRQTKELEGQSTETQPNTEVAEKEEVTTAPQPVDSVAPHKAIEAATAEILPPHTSDVTVPFRPQESVPANAERTAGTGALEPVPVEVPSVQPTAATEQASPFSGGRAVIDDDEPLLERWKKRHRLSKGEVKVLRVMARMCRETGGAHCYVKIPQLMADADLKERQTQLVLRSLRELRLIEKLANYSNADRMGTKYRIFFEAE
jgi:hypothetical protein